MGGDRRVGKQGLSHKAGAPSQHKGSGKVKATEIAGKIRRIGDAARAVFVDREELISAIECGVVAGEHMIVLGPPGTGKSACISFFAKSAGLAFFRRVLNPDTPREDLVGPIDPIALQQGRWDRAWAGLATCDIAFLDEPGKASSQVINMLLDAMEERRVTSGNIDRKIPLHLVMSASNETIDESPAVWDRFSIRLVVNRLSEASDFAQLLVDAWGALSPIDAPIAREELRAMRKECIEMAARAYESPSIMRAMIRLWQGIGDVASEPVSDRRWLRLLVVAAAAALLDGREEISSRDLQTARWVLWSDIDDILPIEAFIREVLDEEKRELATATGLVEELERLSFPWMAGGNSPSSADNLAIAAKVLYRARRMLPEVAERGNGDWRGLQIRLGAVIAAAEEK